MACNKECGCVCNINGLAHIGVFIKDINKSRDFYTEMLGFECYFEGEVDSPDGAIKVAFVRCGSCEIELVQLPVPDERTEGVVAHIALDVNDIDAVQKCLESKGIEFDTKEPIHLPMIFDNGVKYINFRGPDGEIIELNQTL